MRTFLNFPAQRKGSSEISFAIFIPNTKCEKLIRLKFLSHKNRKRENFDSVTLHHPYVIRALLSLSKLKLKKKKFLNLAKKKNYNSTIIIIIIINIHYNFAT